MAQSGASSPGSYFADAFCADRIKNRSLFPALRTLNLPDHELYPSLDGYEKSNSEAESDPERPLDRSGLKKMLGKLRDLGSGSRTATGARSCRTCRQGRALPSSALRREEEKKRRRRDEHATFSFRLSVVCERSRAFALTPCTSDRPKGSLSRDRSPQKRLPHQNPSCSARAISSTYVRPTSST